MKTFDRLIKQGVSVLKSEAPALPPNATKSDAERILAPWRADMKRRQDRLVSVVEAIEGAVVVDTTQVLEWFYNQSGYEDGAKLADVPNAAPPFPVLFLEGALPASMRARSKVERIGCLIRALDLHKPSDREIVANLQNAPEDFLESAFGGPRWLLYCTPFIDYISDVIAPVTVVYSVNEDGTVLPKGGLSWHPGFEGGAGVAGGASATIIPFLFALSFMHCKNVTLAEHKPARKESLRHARVTKGKPLTDWYALDVRPMRRVVEHEAMGQGGATDMERTAKALHIVRGHFKTFTPDKPLFGKHTGRYFWGDLTRGDVAQGVRHKGYRPLPNES